MSEEKSKSYDFDADDPFGENPLETPPGDSFEEGEDMDEFSDIDLNSPDSPDSPEKNPIKGANSEEPSKKSKAAAGIIDLLKENYLYIIGGVVVLVVLYYMYGMIFPSAPPPPRQPAVQQQNGAPWGGVPTQPVTVPHAAQPQTAPVNNLMNASPTMSFTQDDLKQMIEGFSNVVATQNAKIATQISAIAASQTNLTQEETSLTATQAKDLDQLNAQITALNQAISQSNQSMRNIAQALLRTQSELKLLLAEKAQSKDQLVLRAVVPGRAWLVDGAGKTLSVAVGDEIQNYGKVERIDDKSATVIMSSGYVFN